LEATPSVKQRYLGQTARCTVDFLYRALEIGSNCDINYKSSKNPRLHVELSLIRLCRLTAGGEPAAEKKKPDEIKMAEDDQLLAPPSKSEIIRQAAGSGKNVPGSGKVPVSHIPADIEKPSKSFSIKELISEDSKVPVRPAPAAAEVKPEPVTEKVEDFNPETFAAAWEEFRDHLIGEGPRIISMFKSIRPEMENEQLVRIHLTNAAQRDLFVQNYRQKLITFLRNKFTVDDLDIETNVDLSEKDEILYTDEQKYNYLVTKYPVLKEFKKSFNLDFS
jgi:DNA polymerase-3 subunit gamma/tau